MLGEDKGRGAPVSSGISAPSGTLMQSATSAQSFLRGSQSRHATVPAGCGPGLVSAAVRERLLRPVE